MESGDCSGGMPTFPGSLCLNGLPILAKLGLSASLAVLGLGLWAAVQHIEDHHAKNDGDKSSLSLTDIEGAYHGISVPSPLRAVLQGRAAEHPSLSAVPADALTALNAWLAGERILETYDDIDLGDRAPAELIATHCGACHAGDAVDPAVGQISLAYWEDLAPLISDKEIRPTPYEILITSLHTHAPAMALMALVVGILALLSRFPRFLASLPLALSGLGLLIDVSGWLIARWTPGYAPVLMAGGATFFLGQTLGSLLIFAEMWLPRRNRP
jgi:mono/diheme cytochrome c family protein